jgi:20S proteasome subunit beta 2
MHLPYGSMGSGSLAAMGILDSKYKENMDEESAIKLVAEAIEAGIFFDLGSGSNVDVCVIKKGSSTKIGDYKRYLVDTEKATPQNTFPKGTTEVLSRVEKKWKIVVEPVDQKMDIV